jgi:SprA family protein
MRIPDALPSMLRTAYYAHGQAAQSHRLREPPEKRTALPSTAQPPPVPQGASVPRADADETKPRHVLQPSAGLRELSESDQRVIAELRQRDREVRTHEMAHLLAAGPHARGGPQYTYEIGPDGKRYAVEGSVPLDVSPVPGDPQATLQKAMALRGAALAPAHPSGADMAIAAKATAMIARARHELLSLQRQEHAAGPGSDISPATTTRQDGVVGTADTPATERTATVLSSYHASCRPPTMFSVTV